MAPPPTSPGARGGVPSVFSESDTRRLEEISRAVGLPVPPGFLPACHKFMAELARWNRRVNLVSRADEQRLVERHLLDSLCLLSLERDLRGKNILDVGSGAGFPGLVLAIWEPDASVFLVESAAKKVAFLKAAARSVGLKNVRVTHSRLEELREMASLAGEDSSSGSSLPLSGAIASGIDVAVSRAVGDTTGLARNAGRLLRPGGVFVLYKGAGAAAEASQVAPQLEHTFSVEVTTPPWNTLTRLMVLRKLA